MITVPDSVKQALEDGRFFYADLVEINLGKAYKDSTEDVIRYFTTAGHDIHFGGKDYKSGGLLLEAGQISRKTGSGSDNIDLVFSATDQKLVKEIKARQYNNKPCKVYRVLLDDNGVIGDKTIPVRSAVAVAHDIDFTSLNPTITLICDTILGSFGESNPYWITDSDHKRHYPDDRIMETVNAVRNIQGGGEIVYSSDNPEGVVAPEAARIIYGHRDVELTHLIRTYHYREKKAKIGNRDNRWYQTNFVLLVSHGKVGEVDLSNMKMNGARMNFKKGADGIWRYGAWSAYVRDDSNNQKDARTDPKLRFLFDNSAWGNIWSRFSKVYGQGLTVVYMRYYNKQHREKGYKGWLNRAITFTCPVKGRAVYDPRSGVTAYSSNPALQINDFIKDKQFGGGNLGIGVDIESVKNAANYYDNITYPADPNSISKIESHQIISTDEDYSAVFGKFEKTARMVISDYTGKLKIMPEKPEATSLRFTTDDLIGGVSVEGGNLSDRVNRQIVTIKTFVKKDGKIESVSFDCIFPQDTVKGKEIYQKWLEEDGGRPLEKAESVDFIESQQNGVYHAAVLARKSRNIDTAEISPPPISWLLEPYDVISITDEVTEQQGRLWRVLEVNEEDGQVTLSLEDYDANVYKSDLTALPDPDYPTETPEIEAVEGITGLKLKTDADKTDEEKGHPYVFTWDSVTNPQLSHYQIYVYKYGDDKDEIGEASYTTTETTNSHIVRDISGGVTYVIAVEAVTNTGEHGEESTYKFIHGLPKAPTNIDSDSGPYTIELRPSVSNSPWLDSDLTYNFFFNEKDQRHDGPDGTGGARYFATARQATKDALRPETTYFFWVSTNSPNGTSPTETKFTLKTDKSDLVNQVTSRISSDNGFFWLQKAGRGDWLPNNNPITITCDFTDSKATWSAKVKCELDKDFGTIKGTLLPGKHIDVNVNINGTDSSALTIDFEHTPTKTKTAATVGAVASGKDGADGAGGTSASVTLDNTESWVKAPNSGLWFPSNYTTNADCTFKAGGATWKARATAVMDDKTGNISGSFDPNKVDPEISVSFRNQNSSYLLVEFLHKKSGAGQSVTFSTIKGGDKGDKGNTGSSGTNGKNGKMIIAAFKKSKTKPTLKPSGKTLPPPGWSLNPPTLAKGEKSWVSYTFSEDNGKSGDGSWTEIGQHSGTDGTDGKDGAEGKIIRGVYKVSAVKPGDIAQGVTRIPPDDTWILSPPTSVPKGSKAWACYTYSDKVEDDQGSGYWTPVGQHSGPEGTDGAPGKDGEKGATGANGMIIRSVYMISVGQPNPPRGTTIPPVRADWTTWNRKPPISVPKGSKAWVCYTYSRRTGDNVGSGFWTDVGIFSGLSGKDGTNGQPGKDGAPGKDGEPGKDGTNGRNGADGQIIRSFYQVSKSKPNAPSQGNKNLPPDTNWKAEAPIIRKGEISWVVHTYAKDAVIKTGSGFWTKVSRFSGNDGTDGTDGAPGKDGKPGAAGANGMIIRSVYMISVGQPNPPRGTTIPPVRADWTTWNRKPPTSVPKGSKAWVCYTYSKLATDNIGSGFWTDVGIFSGLSGKDGANGQPGKDGNDGAPGKDGTNGKDGANGKIVRSFYQVSKTQPNAPSQGNKNLPPDVNWKAEAPVIRKGEIAWVVHSYADNATTKLGSGFWTKVSRFSGNDGNDGNDGAPGKDGTNGKDGANGKDGSPGRRGSQHAYTEILGNEWDDSPEKTKNLFPNHTLVDMDTVTQSNPAAKFAITKMWNGRDWLDVEQVINGALVVQGTITAKQIAAKTITADEIASNAVTTGKIEANTEIVTPLLKGGEIFGQELNCKDRISAGAGNQIAILSGKDKDRIWVGDISPDRANFRVDQDGNLTAKNGRFSGTLDGADGTFSGKLEAATGEFKGKVFVENLEGDVLEEQTFNMPDSIRRIANADYQIMEERSFEVGIDNKVKSTSLLFLKQQRKYKRVFIPNGPLRARMFIPGVMTRKYYSDGWLKIWYWIKDPKDPTKKKRYDLAMYRHRSGDDRHKFLKTPSGSHGKIGNTPLDPGTYSIDFHPQALFGGGKIFSTYEWWPANKGHMFVEFYFDVSTGFIGGGHTQMKHSTLYFEGQQKCSFFTTKYPSFV